MGREGGMKKKVLVLLAAALSVIHPAVSEADTGSGPVNSFYIENDALYHTDRHYTSGLRYSRLSEAQDQVNSSLGVWIHDLLPLVDINQQPGYEKRTGMVFGQNIYTPQNLAASQPIPDDRPYAGWLYGGYILQNYDQIELKKMEIDLGVVGPYSFAEETQKAVHRPFGWIIPQGWGNQLKTEPGIIINYEDRFKVPGKPLFGVVQYDSISRVGWSLGNIMTFGSIGNTVRIGYNLPNDFGNGHISPSAAPLREKAMGQPGAQEQKPAPRWGIYVFGDVEGRWVLRNIFLDGNTWRTGPHVDKEALVADLEFGVAVIIYKTEIAYRQVTRTKEFKGQPAENRFGSLSVIVRF